MLNTLNKIFNLALKLFKKISIYYSDGLIEHTFTSIEQTLFF